MDGKAPTFCCWKSTLVSFLCFCFFFVFENVAVSCSDKRHDVARCGLVCDVWIVVGDVDAHATVHKDAVSRCAGRESKRANGTHDDP